MKKTYNNLDIATSAGLLKNHRITVENDVIIDISKDTGSSKNMLAFPNVIDLCYLDDNAISPPLGFSNIIIPHSRRVGITIPTSASNRVHRLPTLTKNNGGAVPTDMHLAKQQGVIGVSHWQDSWSNLSVMADCYQQAKELDLLVTYFPLDAVSASQGMIHNSKLAFHLGLSSLPRYSEVFPLDQVISFSQQYQNRIHVLQISSTDSIKHCQHGKILLKNFSVGVSIFHLLFNQECLSNYQSQYKILPPLREEEDREALLSAISDGTIDVISSAHSSIAIAEKRIPFSDCVYGSESQDWFLLKLIQFGNEGILDWSTIVNAVSINPARIAALPHTDICIGNQAQFCVVDLNQSTTINKSIYTDIFAGKKINGKIIKNVG